MRVLMISGDKNVLVPGTSAHERYTLQAAQVEALDIVIWPHQSFFKPFFIRGKYDVVTSQDPFWRGLIARLIARRIGAKLNIQVHADLAAQTVWRQRLVRYILRHADSVRVVSDHLKKVVERYTKAPIAVLPIFIDIQTFQHIERKLHPRFGTVILWVGRFESEKDPLYALEILEQVRAAGVAAGLIMLGSGSLEKDIRAAVKKKQLSEWVELPGWQATPVFLAQAHVVVCTSREESWGGSIIEALAAGVPVVAPDVGIAREAGATIVEHKELAQKTLEILRSGVRGQLLLHLPNAEEWATKWKHTLTI